MKFIISFLILASAAAADSKNIQCWGNDAAGQLNVPPLKNPKPITTNYSSNLNYFGANDFGQSTQPDNVAYSGAHDEGQLNVPKTIGKDVRQLSTGFLQSCAVTK